MPHTPHPDPARRSHSPCATNLRPDLAAFFALASREMAPRRLVHEHGVLAELRRYRRVD